MNIFPRNQTACKIPYNHLCFGIGKLKVRSLNQSRSKDVTEAKFPARQGGKHS